MPSDEQAYESFLKTVSPYIVGMVNGSFDLDRRSYWAKRKAGNFEKVLRSSYALDHVDEGYFDVSASFEFSMRSIEKTEGSEDTSVVLSPLRVSCVFHGHFHFDGDGNVEFIRRFIDEDSWVMFWPYFRQFVSDVTARMSIPPELLPLALSSGEVTTAIPAKQQSAKEKRVLKSNPRLKLKGRVKK